MRECRMKIQQARKYALSLPETTEEPHFEYSSFRVCGKIFATLSPNGDYLHIFQDRARAFAGHAGVIADGHGTCSGPDAGTRRPHCRKDGL